MKVRAWLSSLAGAAILLTASAAQAQFTARWLLPRGAGGVSVLSSVAYDNKHHVYLLVWEQPVSGGSTTMGRFSAQDGTPLGDVFDIGLNRSAYATTPKVAYSRGTADDAFLVSYFSDAGGAYSSYAQAVRYTGTGPTGGTLVGGTIVVSPNSGNPLCVSKPNDVAYNPVTSRFFIAYEEYASKAGCPQPGSLGTDVFVRPFTAAGAALSGPVNVVNAAGGQGQAALAVDWQRNLLAVAFDGDHPLSPGALGAFIKTLDGASGQPVSGLLTLAGGFNIEPALTYLPERDGFLAGWTSFDPDRNVTARFVPSTSTTTLGTAPFLALSTGGQDGAPSLDYDYISRNVFVGAMSDPKYIRGSLLDGLGTALTGAFVIGSQPPANGSFFPTLRAAENGFFGMSYTVDYVVDVLEGYQLPAAATPGPSFGGNGAGAGFSKSAPGNGAANQPLSLTLSWSASPNATNYRYCLDTLNNNACDSGWISTGTATNATVSLAGHTTYFWHVVAESSSATTEANGGTWFSFTTESGLPGAFNKFSPGDGMGAIIGGSVTLSWSASANATNYRYCIDTFNNNACDSAWVSTGTSTSATLSLAGGVRYFWHVVAENANGAIQSDGGLWRWFKTRVDPGDFTGDSKPDLVWQDPTSGAVLLWEMNGTQFVRGTSVSSGGTLWHIVGSGDFTGDGKADLVWQHPDTGAVLLWQMDGATLLASSMMTAGDTLWHVAAVGDFTGDGKPDLIWQHPSSGAVLLWEMNGTAYVRSTFLNTGGTLWRVSGTGDFNGDGYADLLWQHPSTGALLLWEMAGTTYLGSVMMTGGGTEWQVTGVDDFNSDGKPDIVWQHPSTGGVLVWMMNHEAYSDGTLVLSGGTTWKVRAPR